MKCPNCNARVVTPLKYHMCSFFRVKRNKRSMVLITLLFIAFGTLIVQTAIHKFDKPPVLKNCHAVPLVESRWSRMVKYFKSKGNKHPEQMATAVLETKRPKIMAAIATKGELNTPYTVKRGGYKKAHVGAWQVNEKIHGKAGNLPLDQALKAEDVLEGMLKESKGNMKAALSNYGGDTRNRYANNILAEIEKIP